MLRCSIGPRITAEDLRAERLKPSFLLEEGFIRRLPGLGGWRPPGCEHGCSPILEFEEREAQGLVGIVCPREEPCWPGIEWFPVELLEAYVCDRTRVLEALARQNKLAPLDGALGMGVVGVGLSQARGKRIGVVWTDGTGVSLDSVCIGLRYKLGGDGLIVLVSKATRVEPTLAAHQVVVLELAEDPRGDLGLRRALDVLDPDYATRRLKAHDGVFEEVEIWLGSEPEKRHVVRINGVEIEGFEQSDLKFLRLVLLAKARVEEAQVGRGGWVEQAELAVDTRWRQLDDVRAALRDARVPHLSRDELGQLIKVWNQNQRARLAVPPENIILDESLRRFVALGPAPARMDRQGQRGSADYKKNIDSAVERAEGLITAIRKLGLPLSTIAP